MSTSSERQYKHLEARPGSKYRALWLKGRRIRAAVVWEYVHGPDHLTPEEIAKDFQLPLEGVLEALDYVDNNQEAVQRDRDRELATLRAQGIEWPPPESDEPSSEL
jgi:uncharacterized protein (DUF433 family)